MQIPLCTCIKTWQMRNRVQTILNWEHLETLPLVCLCVCVYIYYICLSPQKSINIHGRDTCITVCLCIVKKLWKIQICLCRLLFLPFSVKLPYLAFHMLPRLILKELKRHSCHWEVAFLRTCLTLALILFVTVILL